MNLSKPRFRKGTVVVITDYRMTFDTYNKLAVKLKATNYRPKELPVDKDVGVVKAVSKHLTEPDLHGFIYLVCIRGQDFLMCEKALKSAKLGRKNTRFYC